ncbi:MAG: glycosyltransferase [Bacteroidetes bacterium]|nr:glycosyltransferase [Bacteroidota bacterium]MBV6461837.1 N-acetyl-alpha-D-glucosaminyl L-malate synthase [Flavobacteriales bacterium]WKZ75951.1 MAG: glycosyltransferase [Vicingaceae bacterium]MCL4816669.1 glycosyltransferase [Flavobacteriales bacterium]NOG95627.1 glycosyltransferase [Bacteroidota bacterium]
MLKIKIIGPAFPLRGGIAAFNERLSLALQNEGHSVEIISFSLQYPRFLFPGKTQYSSSQAPSNIIIHTKINSINPFNWLLVGLKIKSENPDLVIVRYWLPFMAPCLGTIARLIKTNQKTKVIALADNIIPHEKRMGDQLLTRYFVKSCHAFIVMSRSVEDDLRKFLKQPKVLFHQHPLYEQYGTKVETSIARKKININENERVILFFGFIRSYKGLDILLEAMSNEQVRKLNIKLIVAGEFYEDEIKYRNLIEALSLKNNVVFFNEFIPDEEVKYFFSASDLVVQPYKTATQSGVTQIAYQFDLPMLVTHVGGLPEMVTHLTSGYVVEVNPDIIANSLYDFFIHKRKDQFSEGVREEKKRFSWKKMTEEIMKFYSKL